MLYFKETEHLSSTLRVGDMDNKETEHLSSTLRVGDMDNKETEHLSSTLRVGDMECKEVYRVLSAAARQDARRVSEQGVEIMERLLAAMMEYDRGDAKRIQHFVKVYEFARTIGIMEKLDEHTQFVLESAAIVHDIGIHISEQKYGSSSGKYQELEGPAEAEKLLMSLGWPENVIERVSYLVGHHHTYHNMEGLDHQILVEADFLVNLYEDEISLEGQKNAYERIFRTESGRRMCRLLYPAVSGQDE